tara:strand:- start:1004 stop:1384 length:381 start_codon:yes stop_codon:yes gene_type:complete
MVAGVCNAQLQFEYITHLQKQGDSAYILLPRIEFLGVDVHGGEIEGTIYNRKNDAGSETIFVVNKDAGTEIRYRCGSGKHFNSIVKEVRDQCGRYKSKYWIGDQVITINIRLHTIIVKHVDSEESK